MQASDSFQPVFQVSEFNEVVNQHLSLLNEVTVEGELTRLDVKNGRLIFASLKDATSSLDVFSLSHQIRNYREFEPGMLVRVTGTVGLYRGSSRFRLHATSMVPQGEGALQIAFEKLKARLESEGLFAPERKRSLPPWPKNIGIITAVNSSAYHDVLKILSARMRGLHLKVLPVSVQGREAVPSIQKAFTYINQHAAGFDLVIMARGGGSLEDLQAFNDEAIARAVFSAKVPVISAIGHEDNWSLTDYVADLRASTPSNAAELAVADRHAVIQDINARLAQMNHSLKRELQLRSYVVNKAAAGIRQQLVRVKTQIPATLNLMRQSLNHHLLRTKDNLDSLIRLAQSLDYQRTLDRGFSITKNSQGQIVKSAAKVQANDAITTQLAQGSITSYVK
jgi:exodeoxyribonuclease VII large subunit